MPQKKKYCGKNPTIGTPLKGAHQKPLLLTLKSQRTSPPTVPGKIESNS